MKHNQQTVVKVSLSSIRQAFFETLSAFIASKDNYIALKPSEIQENFMIDIFLIKVIQLDHTGPIGKSLPTAQKINYIFFAPFGLQLAVTSNSC